MILQFSHHLANDLRPRVTGIEIRAELWRRTAGRPAPDRSAATSPAPRACCRGLDPALGRTRTQIGDAGAARFASDRRPAPINSLTQLRHTPAIAGRVRHRQS